jgi:hypothetical protein
MSKVYSDFSLLNSLVLNAQKDNSLNKASDAFYFVALDHLLNLQSHEIDDSITDSSYLKSMGKEGGHDRGIDALYIDTNDSPITIHLFNFKYTEKFENTENNFPSGEIDKILSFINSLQSKDENLEKEVNITLFEKVKEIWSIFNSSNPKFVIHFCSNYYNGLEKSEFERVSRGINRFSSFEIKEHKITDFIKLATHKDRKKLDVNIKAIDKKYFEKSDGDIRALIVDVDVRDLIRIVMNDDDLRLKPDLTDYSVLKSHKILEDAFEDNVRVYLKDRSRINKNIKETALSEHNHKFFYYNNGITITCSSFSYPKGVRSPIIEIKDFQIVNGSQTVHALYEAFIEQTDKFEEIDILCRIYETQNLELSTDIAEFTNSQNPVKSRDIRSNDYIQKKLEKELGCLGYYYERKKGQYSDKNKDKIIDSELTGQVLMAFNLELPADAKDKKRLIFADSYETIFCDNINANMVLLPYMLFKKIEEQKIKFRKKYLAATDKFSADSFILHSSFYFLYALKRYAENQTIELKYENIEEVWKNYNKAKNILKKAVQREMENSKKTGELYSHRIFFKGNKPQDFIKNNLK